MLAKADVIDDLFILVHGLQSIFIIHIAVLNLRPILNTSSFLFRLYDSLSSIKQGFNDNNQQKSSTYPRFMEEVDLADAPRPRPFPRLLNLCE